MALLTKRKYTFTSSGMDAETFSVVSFKGVEAISKPYEFEIELVSEKTDIDPLEVLENPAKFTIHRDEGDNVDFNGILMQFEETREFHGYLFFRAVLAPKLWWLSLTHHNQVFLNKTVPQIMEAALGDGGLNEGIDFSFDLQNHYAELEYVCQYDESHFNFVSRWAEREGIYYFFEQTSTGEKVVFTDNKIRHTDLPLGRELTYDPPSGLASLHMDEVIHAFICKHNMLPKRVFLKDYNYLKPSLAVEGRAEVDERGRGENYIYGVNFDSVAEGNRLAQIRADTMVCRKSVFNGQSSVPFIIPGYTFDLKRHYKDAYNRKYLVTDITHEGHQTGYLISALGSTVSRRDEEMFYSNSFSAIYADAQFRPEHVTERPKITGTINAKIDASTSGEYAELDEYGRYKVRLPFDLSDQPGGKASAWFRMVQPYAGRNKGMHFPLHKGTEVLLTFIDGNPDRPVIAGAVPNPETASPVTAGLQTLSIIRSNRDRVEAAETDIDAVEAAVDATEAEIDDIKDNFIELQDQSGKERIKIHSDGDLRFEARNRYAEYTIGGPEDEKDVPEGLKYLWNKFYGTSPDFNPSNMLAYSYPESATGATPSVDPSTMAKLAKSGKVQLAKGDTFNTQDGNIYDFGGYWDYNLGNSYTENFMDQSGVTLNDSNLEKDKADKGGPGYSKIEHLKKHKTNVWVEKVIKGASYEYAKQHDSLEVNYKCNSTEYKYGGKTVEYKYTGKGTKIYHMESEKGTTTENFWDRNTGAWKGYHTQYDSGIAHEAFTFDFKHKNVAEIRFGDEESFSLSGSAKGLVNINLGACASANFDFSASASFNLSASASAAIHIGFAASADLKLGSETGIEIDKRTGGLLKLSPSGKLELEAIGMTARKEAAIKAKKATIEAESREITLDNILTQISKNTAKIEKNSVDIASNEMRMQMGFELAGL